MGAKKSLISFENFSFRYDSQVEPTLKNINLTINRGETVLLTGQSGSGKSTLAKCLNGLIPNQDEGQITGKATIAGKKLSENTHASIVDLSFLVGTLLQDADGQFTGLTVAEDVAFALENDAVNQGEMHAMVEAWAKKLDLLPLLTHAPQQLSGGQKQRVALAGVLISEPQILLLDEPLASLDPQAAYATLALLKALSKQNNLTTIIVEHRIEMVLNSGVDRVVVMADGTIVSDSTPQTLLETSTLERHGLKVPMYLEVLQAAGVDLTTAQNLADPTALTLPNDAMTQVTAWMKRVKPRINNHSTQPLLELINCSYCYQNTNTKALANVSTTLYRGELISLVGQNGAGKSTFLKAICGFIKASGQQYWVNADGSKVDLTQQSIKQRADLIGFVMQNPNQMLSQKIVFDEVALGLRLRDVDEATITQKVEAILRVCHLYEYRHWPLSALSFGQKKRLSIAAILVLEPQLLILDEPTAGQDFKNYVAMMDFIVELNQKLNLTILVVTHDVQLMAQYTNRTLVFSRGRLLADTTPRALSQNEVMLKSSALRAMSSVALAQNLGVDAEQLTQAYLDFWKKQAPQRKGGLNNG